MYKNFVWFLDLFLQNVHASLASQYVSINMPSEMTIEDVVTMEAVSVLSAEGEMLHLLDTVRQK